MGFLRLWLLLTGVLIAGALMWSFAPILIPMLIVAGLLGLVALGVIAAARWIEGRRRARRVDPPESDA